MHCIKCFLEAFDLPLNTILYRTYLESGGLGPPEIGTVKERSMRTGLKSRVVVVGGGGGS